MVCSEIKSNSNSNTNVKSDLKKDNVQIKGIRELLLLGYQYNAMKNYLFKSYVVGIVGRRINDYAVFINTENYEVSFDGSVADSRWKEILVRG